jgi:hypothetical protein
MHTEFWWRKRKKRDYVEDTRVDIRIILKWILRKYDGKQWTSLIWLRRDKWRIALNSDMNTRVA